MHIGNFVKSVMTFNKGDLVDVGGYTDETGPRYTQVYKIIEQPVGKYAKCILAHQECLKDPPVFTFYMGRWFTKTFPIMAKINR